MKIREFGSDHSDKPDRQNATWDQQQNLADLQAELDRELDLEPKSPTQKNPQQIPQPQKTEGNPSPCRKGTWNDNNRSGGEKIKPWLSSLFLLIPLAFFGYLTFSAKKTEPSKSSSKRNLSQKTFLDLDSDILTHPAFSGETPLQIADSFLNCSDPQERLQYVRNPEKMASLMASFPEQARSETPVNRQLVINPVTKALGMILVKTVFEDYNTRSLYLVGTEDGPKVDWEAYSRSNKTLQKWFQNDSSNNIDESCEARVYISKEHYYNFRYSDDQIWDSYRIIIPESEQSVTGYAKKGTPTAAILSPFINDTMPEQRVTLQLRNRSEDSQKQQFEIEAILSVTWVMNKENLEEAWIEKIGKFEQLNL